ncbi:MAG: RsmE family RNA methyltransferase, partial [Anaerovoracaceae bacterium]
IKDVLRLHSDKDIKSLAVIIGPEGGFSDDEASRIVEAGGKSVSLGKTVLRTETAGIAAVSMIMYELEL